MPGLGEYLAGLFAQKVDKGVVSSTRAERGYFERKDPTFAVMGKYLLADTDIRASITTFAINAVGPRFHLTHGNHLAIEDRKENDDADEAIRICEEWMRRWDFWGWALWSARDLWGFGNAIGEYMTLSQLRRVSRLPMSSVYKMRITSKGRVVGLIQDIDGEKTTWQGADLASLLHMNWDPVDTGVIGRGVLHTLCTSGVGYSYRKAGSNELLTEYRPPLASIKEENDHSLLKALHHFNPKHIVLGSGIPDEIGKSLAEQIQSTRQEDVIVATMPQGGRSDAQKPQLQVEHLTTESRTQVSPIVDRFDRQIQKMVMDPANSMMFGEIEASDAMSRTVERYEGRIISLFQSSFGYQLMERVFTPILLQEGYTEDQLYEYGLVPTWNPLTRLEVTLDGLLSAGQANFLGRDEIRRFLESSGIPLSAKPEYMGIQGGATLVDGKAQSSAAAGYDKAGANVGQRGEEEALQRV